MTFDMRQFLATFFEESFEGLDGMETSLLNLDLGNPDRETINSIFRGAHSIKGGGATFGLSEISAFTHSVETLLDEMRDGRRGVTREWVELLLRAVDCMRAMLTAAKEGTALESAKIASLSAELSQALGKPASVARVAATAAAGATAGDGWRVIFRPQPHMLKTGNDPLRMLRELAALGEATVKLDSAQLPAFVDLNPEELFLGWEVELRGDVSEAQIKEIFEWVDGDCELRITPLAAADAAVTPSASNVVASAAKTAAAALELASAPVERRNTTERRQAPVTDAGSIRVGIDKVDALINMVGELVITQSMLHQLGANFSMERLAKLQEGLAQLERNTRELQENVMRIRMLPISFAFNRFPRMVHDLSQKLGKKVELLMSGEQTELDKTVMEKIGDPLVHLVRNSIDHGIEMPEKRVAAGKSEMGTVKLNAYHQGGNIVIEIIDDGAGLNKDRIRAKAIERGIIAKDQALDDSQICALIFEAGFSTAEVVSDVSGRGVGMDVVRRNIKDLGGTVDVATQPGAGTTFTIRLPLTLAILDGQLVRVGQDIYIIPLVSIVESLQIRREDVNVVAGRSEVYKLRDEYLPVVRLYEQFGCEADNTELEGGLLVVVEGDGKRAGLFVDDLLNQQQVVIKSLETNYAKVPGISGATILGDGHVALILDVAGIIAISNDSTSDRNALSKRRLRSVAA